MTIFLLGKLKCGFPENLNDNGKRLSFLVSKVTIKKSYEASQKLPLTALSARYMKFLLLYQENWWDAWVCLSYPYCLVLFLYVFLFVILRIFSMFFFQTSYNYLYSSFLFLIKHSFVNWMFCRGKFLTIFFLRSGLHYT